MNFLRDVTEALLKTEELRLLEINNNFPPYGVAVSPTGERITFNILVDMMNGHVWLKHSHPHKNGRIGLIADLSWKLHN